MKEDIEKVRAQLADRFRERPSEGGLYGALCTLDQSKTAETIGAFGIKQNADAETDLRALRESGLAELASFLEAKLESRWLRRSAKHENQAIHWLFVGAALVGLYRAVDDAPELPTSDHPHLSSERSIGPSAAIFLVLSTPLEESVAKRAEVDSGMLSGWVRRARRWRIAPSPSIEASIKSVDTSTDDDTGLVLVVIETAEPVLVFEETRFQGSLADWFAGQHQDFAVQIHALCSDRGLNAIFDKSS